MRLPVAQATHNALANGPSAALLGFPIPPLELREPVLQPVCCRRWQMADSKAASAESELDLNLAIHVWLWAVSSSVKWGC